MNRLTKTLAISAFLCAALSPACHVSVPINGEIDGTTIAGKVFHLQRDLILANTGFVRRNLTAFETDEEEDLKSRGQFEQRIATGTQIRIARIVSKRMEPGIFHFYECEVTGSALKFLLPFSMRDSIGLPEYKHWP